MGKSEKLVVLGVLLVVVLLFVWSLQGSSSPDEPIGGIYAADRDSAVEPPMNERAKRQTAPQPGTTGPEPRPLDASAKASETVAAGSGESSAGLRSEEVLARAGQNNLPGSTKMLLAETQGGSAVEISSTGSARRSTSSMADPAVHNDESEGATSRSGLSRFAVRMQPGWDLITTSGLQGTVDPSMFLYDVTAAGATWESIAKDLYGDEDKASLLQHNNEGMDSPTGPIFVPAKDDLGRDASVRTVEVLQGESLWQVAKRTLGKGSEWKAVYEANRDVISDPDFVAPGTMLKIPVR